MDAKEAFLVVESTKAVLYDAPARCPECVLQKSQSMFPDLPSRNNPLLTTPGSKVYNILLLYELYALIFLTLYFAEFCWKLYVGHD